MSEGTARNKLPSTGSVSIPQLKHPPLHHREAASLNLGSASVLGMKPDEDQTMAYRVPDELLRRARTGLVPTLLEDEKSPDSGAITAPPPVETSEQVSLFAPRAPGVPHDLLMSLLNAEQAEEEEVTILRPSIGFSELDDTHKADGWRDDVVDFAPVAQKHDAFGRTSVAANDSARSVLRPRVKPGVAPVVLWLIVLSVTAGATALVWLIR